MKDKTGEKEQKIKGHGFSKFFIYTLLAIALLTLVIASTTIRDDISTWTGQIIGVDIFSENVTVENITINNYMQGNDAVFIKDTVNITNTLNVTDGGIWARHINVTGNSTFTARLNVTGKAGFESNFTINSFNTTGVVNCGLSDTPVVWVCDGVIMRGV